MKNNEMLKGEAAGRSEKKHRSPKKINKFNNQSLNNGSAALNYQLTKLTNGEGGSSCIRLLGC